MSEKQKDLVWIDEKVMEENKKKWAKSDFIKKVIDDIDIDNDGEIDYNEFKTWFLGFLDYGSPNNETKITKKLRKTKDEDGNKQLNNYVLIKQLGFFFFYKIKKKKKGNLN
jgi:Ca2+-binding EF-hand superfamily protein